MAKISFGIVEHKIFCFVILCLFVYNIFWYVQANIAMEVKEIHIGTTQIKGYGFFKKEEEI